jgi:hypothetical protein
MQRMGWAAMVLCAVMMASASPQVEFDKITAQCGTVTEGKDPFFSVIFTATNSGDAPLHIENVRPGCSCTSVSFDTVIPPGKSGTIEAKVTVKDLPGGPFSKTVTVTSDASNHPVQNLTIKAEIVALIDISEPFVFLQAQRRDSVANVFLSSARKDLKVTSVTFKPQPSDDDSVRDTALPASLGVQFAWTPTDSSSGAGGKIYKLALHAPTASQTSRGEFVIRTNHPLKPEVFLRGSVMK